MLSNSIKKIIDFISSILPEVVLNYVHTSIGKNFIKTKYTKDELQVELNIFETKYKLQLIERNMNHVDTYLNMSKKFTIYEETMMFLLNTLLESKLINKKEVIFFDIGAYAGYYSNFVAKKLNNNSSVYAIESNPEYCLNMEKTNIINNSTNLYIHNEVFSNREESLIIHKEMVINKDFLLKGMDKLKTYHEIKEYEDILNNGKNLRSKTLDNFCLENSINPSILKIDVHGSEGKVLMGAEKYLKDSVEIIFLELHQQHELNKYSENMTKFEILDLLYKHNFDTYLIAPFRFNEKNIEFQYYRKNNKLLKVQLNKDNYSQILFDRNHTDIFIFCSKNYINIEELECFSS